MNPGLGGGCISGGVYTIGTPCSWDSALIEHHYTQAHRFMRAGTCPSAPLCIWARPPTIRYARHMETYKDIPVMRFADTQMWHDWLDTNYALQSGIWMQIAKKDTGIPSVSRAQALDIALCYGWIDG